jgi:multidrug efflux pump subunit AcrA (membrane-fusion protein)
MSILRKRWLPILLVGLIIGGPVAWYKWPSAASAAESGITAPVKKGEFKVLVSSTGELRANKFVQITGPTQAMTVNVYNTKIASIVPEGTVVKEGDVVAELDRQPAAARAADVTLNLQKAQAEFTTAQLDSTLNLANAREDVRNAELALEEKKIAKEQAQYEAPSIRRQAEIDYEKASRALDQAKRTLDTKTKQAEAKMSSVGADLARQQNMLKNIQDIMATFTIKAPSAGMVIYLRDWNGKKKGVGSQWGAWDPTVATLPDLSQMESQTYINEVDVRKLAVGQKVTITLDADPSKKLNGTVTEIANVGEQRPNQDSKVFEVKVALTKGDTTLRPGMTTANAIEVASVPNALSIPLEAVVTEGGFNYTYKKTRTGIVRQMLELGLTNDNEVIVKKGLEETDHVLLVAPRDKADIKTEVIPGLKPIFDSTVTDAQKGIPVPIKTPSAPVGKTATPTPAPSKPRG